MRDRARRARLAKAGVDVSLTAADDLDRHGDLRSALRQHMVHGSVHQAARTGAKALREFVATPTIGAERSDAGSRIRGADGRFCGIRLDAVRLELLEHDGDSACMVDGGRPLGKVPLPAIREFRSSGRRAFEREGEQLPRDRRITLWIERMAIAGRSWKLPVELEQIARVVQHGAPQVRIPFDLEARQRRMPRGLRAAGGLGVHL